MKRFRFIHAADLHLDSPFRGLSQLPPAIRSRIRESTFEALDRLVSVAEEEATDCVVIAGDVYDTSDRPVRAQIRFQQAMERLAGYGIPAFVIHGNHDPLDGRVARLRWPESVKFFGADKVESFPVITPDRGVVAHVYGISFGTQAVTDNLSVRFEPGDEQVYKIGLLHTNVDGDEGHDNYAPCSKADLLGKRIHYWALGHIHTRRVLHEHPHIVYAGNIQGRHIREQGEKGCVLVDVDHDGLTKLRFVSLDCVRWARADVSIRDLRTEQELKDALEAELERIREEAGGRPAVARITLVGRGELRPLLRRGALLRELTEEWRQREAGRAEADGAYPFVWPEQAEDRTLSMADTALLMEQQGFLGELLQLSSGVADDPQQLEAFVQEAIKPLLNSPKLAKLLSGASSDEAREWLKAAEQLAADLLLDEEGEES